LSVTCGRPLARRVRNPAIARRAASALGALSDFDAGVAEPGDALAVGARIGIAERDHDARHAGFGSRSLQAGPRGETCAQGSRVT
jgi:hypothetical protein